MKLFILSHTLVLIKKIKGNKETSLVYFCYQSSNINCQKGNSYCEIAHMYLNQILDIRKKLLFVHCITFIYLALYHVIYLLFVIISMFYGFLWNEKVAERNWIIWIKLNWNEWKELALVMRKCLPFLIIDANHKPFWQAKKKKKKVHN